VSEYFEQEEVLKSYDARIMRRLLGYLRPYRLVFLLSLLVLAIASVGELSMPVIVQRATDNHILPFHRAVVLDRAGPEVRRRLEPVDGDLVVAGVYYLPAAKLSTLTAREKTQMQQEGTLLAENFLVIRGYAQRPEARRVIAARAELFHVGESAAAIRAEDLRLLSREQIRAVRRPDYQGLSLLAWLFLGILAVVLVTTFLQVYVQAHVGQGIMKDMRTQLYHHTMGLSLKFLDANPVGRLVNRLTNDVETVNELFTTVLPSLLKDFSMMVGVMVALFLLSPRLGLLTLATLPPVLLIATLFRGRAREAFRRVRVAVSSLNSFLSEHISGMRVVQLFVQEERSRRGFQQRNGSLLAASLGEMYVFAVFRPLVDFLSSVSVAVVLYFGASFLLQSLVSLGVLIAFINLIQMFYQPVMDLSEKYNILQSAMAGSERVFALLDTQERIGTPLRPVSLEQVQGHIEFDHVSFWYKEGEPVLRDLSFEVRPGETVAIVGYTGAGKTTIASLLTRLWEVRSGSIRMDGVDIREVPEEVLRRRVQAVLQDVFLFSGTILDNVRLGSEISVEAVHNAVRLVKADGFIAHLPQGLQTPLSERGGNLSMGQRQLLSFARVLAHDPDVLILDEATGNIDTETEKLIQEALVRLLRGRTSLVIAHRLSTIKNADRILVLHRGELVEAGTHEELLRRGGTYHKLYQMQYLRGESPMSAAGA
jgi:ATP-binding cassette subfamily B multidrug efflux pump